MDLVCKNVPAVHGMDIGCLTPPTTISLRCAAGIAAKQGYTDRDIITFLTNVECLEGQFDTWGTFGRGFINGLEMGGPTPIGAQKANLTEATLRYLEEVAINEQVLLPGPCVPGYCSSEDTSCGA